MGFLYNPDGSLRNPRSRAQPRAYSEGNPSNNRVSRKGAPKPASAIEDPTDFVIPAGYVTKDVEEGISPSRPGTKERIRVTLCSHLTIGEGEDSAGLSPTREADADALGARPVSEAKKKALYETRVKLGKCEEDQDESAAHDAAILSEMKRLELSGTAGNVLQPLDEVSPPKVSRRGMGAAQKQGGSSIFFGDDDTPDSSPEAPPKPRIAPMQPPGGTASFHIGW